MIEFKLKGGDRMTEKMERELQNIAASSSIEGIIMTEDQLQTVRDIVDRKLTLQDYFAMLQRKAGACHYGVTCAGF